MITMKHDSTEQVIKIHIKKIKILTMQNQFLLSKLNQDHLVCLKNDKAFKSSSNVAEIFTTPEMACKT